MTKEEKSAKKRGWVKNAIIIFLAVLLLLTFLSNTIMNHSLPVVSAQYPMSGTISAKIRGNGTVSSSESYNVTVEETREVKTVAVKTGDTVTTGQVLFILADKESDELATAKTELETLQFEYENYLLEISASDPTVQSAQQALTKAIKDRDKAKESYTDSNSTVGKAKAAVETAQTEYNSAKAQADSAKTALSAAQKVYDAAELALTQATNALTELNTGLTDQQEDLKKDLTEAETKLENAKLELENATSEKNYLEGRLGMTYEEAETAIDSAAETLSDYESQMYSKKVQWQDINSEISDNNALISSYWDTYEVYLDEAKTTNELYKDAIEQLETDIQELKNKKAISENNIMIYYSQGDYASIKTETENIAGYELSITQKQNQLDEYVTSSDAAGYLDKISSLEASNTELNTSLSTITSELTALSKEYSKAQTSYSSASSVINDSSLIAAKKSYDEATENVKNLQQEVNEETIKYNNSLPNDDPEIDAAKKAVTKATSEKTQAEYDLSTAQKAYDEISSTLTDKSTALEEAKAALSELNTLDDSVSAADDAVSDAQTALSSALEASSITDAKEKLELEQKEKAIAAAKEKIEKLTEAASPQEITARYDGTVTAVNVAVGDKTEYNSPLATIEASGKGYTMELTVTKEQAMKVTVGDKAELTNYWYGDCNIQLVSIASDRDSQGKNKKLVFTVDGEDVIPGQTLSISIGQKSETYDTIVPNSAVKEDSKGKFVYVINVKSSPLGNRYIIKRADVTVTASDDTNSAISGITSSEFVLTNCSEPLQNNMQVRLSED